MGRAAASLTYADPYGDEFEAEEVLGGSGDDDEDVDGMGGGGGGGGMDDDGLVMDDDVDDVVGGGGEVRMFRPGVDVLEEGEELGYDPTAYVMYHALKPEWPALSFDFMRDGLGGARTRFPLECYCVAGSQAATAAQNKLTVMRMSDMHRMPRALGSRNDDDDGDSEFVLDLEGGDDSEEDCEDDPTLATAEVPHPAGVNRVRSCPSKPGVVATWGDDATVRLYDLTAHAAALAGEGGMPAFGTTGPSFEFKHAEEGFAMDWSKVAPGVLATGDCSGAIHVWQPAESGGWAVEQAGRKEHGGSVEELQWSPGEATVFISGSTDQSIKVWDVREARRAMVTQSRAHAADVNVMSWNSSVAYLLASGGDDGTFKIWDLRAFGGAASEPVAHFRWHRQPITSIEWHPGDESVLAVASADDSITIWDMSVEEDAAEAALKAADVAALPPQLLFVHQGQSSLKEVHFHPQLPGVLMSTAADGFNIFKPNTNI